MVVAQAAGLRAQDEVVISYYPYDVRDHRHAARDPPRTEPEAAAAEAAERESLLRAAQAARFGGGAPPHHLLIFLAHAPAAGAGAAGEGEGEGEVAASGAAVAAAVAARHDALVVEAARRVCEGMASSLQLVLVPPSSSSSSSSSSSPPPPPSSDGASGAVERLHRALELPPDRQEPRPTLRLLKPGATLLKFAPPTRLMSTVKKALGPQTGAGRGGLGGQKASRPASMSRAGRRAGEEEVVAAMAAALGMRAWLSRRAHQRSDFSEIG
jgi:hypothetical protein